MDIKTGDRGRNLPGNKVGFRNSQGNAFLRNAKFSGSLSGDTPRKGSNFCPKSSSDLTVKPRENMVCKYWMSGHCARGDKCWYLHSWSRGNGFAMLAKLEGHKKAVQGVALPSGSDKLYSGSTDGAARIWDCNTGKCAHLINLGDEVGSLIPQGPWVFIGMKIVVKVWDTDTLQCIKTLNGHADAVMSLLHCNGCLFSCSLDCTIKVWFATEGQNWEVIYTHNEVNGVLTLSGMNDAETKPVLFCPCNDNTVRLYELPSFRERGRLFSKREIRVIVSSQGMQVAH